MITAKGKLKYVQNDETELKTVNKSNCCTTPVPSVCLDNVL